LRRDYERENRNLVHYQQFGIIGALCGDCQFSEVMLVASKKSVKRTHINPPPAFCERHLNLKQKGSKTHEDKN